MPEPVDHLHVVGEVVARPGDRLPHLLDAFYDNGLELVSRRARTFFRPQTGLRVDLLFDFPIAAATLAEHATRTKIRTYRLAIASEADLLRLKRIARTARSP